MEQANYGANEPPEGDELRVITQTLAGDTNISFTIMQQRRNFLWRPLDQLEPNLRKSSRKALMTSGKL